MLESLGITKYFFKRILANTIVYVCFFGVLFFVVHKIAAGVQDKGLVSGFSFLTQAASFSISESLPVPSRLVATQADEGYWTFFGSTHSFFFAIMAGLSNSFKAFLCSGIISIVFGCFIAAYRIYGTARMQIHAKNVITAIRSLPLIGHLILWYVLLLHVLPPVSSSFSVGDYIYLNNRGLFFTKITSFLPLLFEPPVASFGGRNMSGGIPISPEFITICLGLGFYHSVFAAEIFRAGFESVPTGQFHASFSLHLTKWQTLVHVIFPQSLKVALPSLGSLAGSLFKNSSLGIVIGYPDLVHVGGTIINQTGQALEVVGIWMVLFLALNLIITLLTRLVILWTSKGGIL